jgi:hypothetical protein
LDEVANASVENETAADSHSETIQLDFCPPDQLTKIKLDRDLQSETCCITGDRVEEGTHHQKLKETWFSVRSFGGGAICCRDFKSIVSDAVFIKLSMKHLDTFPDAYRPIRSHAIDQWNTSDLNETITRIVEYGPKSMLIAKAGASIYQDATRMPHTFIIGFLEAVCYHCEGKR